MNPGSRKTVTQGMQRSQSTPNVGVQPTEQHQHKWAPRRIKTSIDSLAALPRNVIREESYADPFHLSGFFPTSPISSDQEQSGWWRDSSLEEDSEEVWELPAVDGDGSSLSSQRILFSKEDKPTDTVIKREDKLGVLSVGAYHPL
jgi:hypothetical protein